MVTRRTKDSIEDMLGRPVTPGSIVVLPVHAAYSPLSLQLLLVDKIYLDDYKGEPYHAGRIFFRNRETGLLYDAPTDEKRQTWAVGKVHVPVPNPEDYVPIVPKKNQLGYGYEGDNEVVAMSSPRISGFPISRNGVLEQKAITYDAWNLLLQPELSVEKIRELV